MGEQIKKTYHRIKAFIRGASFISLYPEYDPPELGEYSRQRIVKTRNPWVPVFARIGQGYEQESKKLQSKNPKQPEKTAKPSHKG